MENFKLSSCKRLGQDINMLIICGAKLKLYIMSLNMLVYEVALNVDLVCAFMKD